ncbi:hypothetical protein [Mesorhizobium sp. WSM2239]|uniref:Uncharacterized protein n=2 Tax=unclassified Mesorhizobium TaxID=325217 RepID=A0AAU8D3G9_9HYPH
MLEVEPHRFADGLNLLEAYQESGPKLAAKPTIFVDLIRPEDLVAFSVAAVGCELVAGKKPVLRPLAGETEAHLVMRFPFQHLAEQASYEGGNIAAPNPFNPAEAPLSGTTIADPRPQTPVAARAANGSRLVFAFPPGETIPFSTSGILAAMSRLKPLVHKLALPGAAPTGQSKLSSELLDDVRLIALPGGLVGVLSGTSLFARKAKRSEIRGLDGPRTSDEIGSIRYHANASRRARRVLNDRTALLDHKTTAPSQAEDRVTVRIGNEEVHVSAIFGPAGLIGEHLSRSRVLRKYSYPPGALETAIEAPYRLIISPSDEGRWSHSLEPVTSKNASHVELWHSRLGHLKLDADGNKKIDERNAGRRIVRAVWARDRDRVTPNAWRDPDFLASASHYPFRMSLSPLDRHMLVRQTSETIPGETRPIEPLPLAARALWLSGLGAWLKLDGSWNTKPYSDASFPSILFMNYAAPLGRDQHVEVAYPGYLFPFGHSATLVKVTDRKMKAASPSLAALYQRKFLVIGEPRRIYADRRDLPFSQIEIRPLVTPTLDDPGTSPLLFWPTVGGQPFNFIIEALDQEMQPARLQMPLMWVAERNRNFGLIEAEYINANFGGRPRREVPAFGQLVAFAPSVAGAVATLPTSTLRFLGEATRGGSIPRMSSAEVVIPAVQQLSAGPPIPITYHPLYKSKGFGGTDNKAELWAQVLVDGEVAPEAKGDLPITLPQLGYGLGGASTEKSGGFLAPSMPLRSLSRVNGAMGSADSNAAKQKFNPKEYFNGTEPKLFGLIPLSDLAVSVDSDLLRIPKLVSAFVSRVEALTQDIARAASVVADAAEEAKRMMSQPGENAAEWVVKINQALQEAEDIKNAFKDIPDQFKDALTTMKSQGKNPAKTFVDKLKTQLEKTIKQLDDLAAKLPLFIGDLLRSIAGLLRTSVHGTIDLIEDMYNYVNGLAESGALARVQFEWKPRVQSWPKGSPLLAVKENSLVFAIGAQAGINGKNETYALAQLVDFTLHLFPDAELIHLDFDRFAFKSSGGKSEIDIVFRNIGFHGVLKFVETIKELIPLDGFSDPPNVNVTAEGLTAGFGLALPDIAMGMFSITNMSLNADVQVPFLGKAVTVGFSFCTRDRPFTIAVAFIGGGGWCGIRLSANGLEVLEVGLEAGACIAVDFGVASGSVSAMLGIYIRLEGEAGSLAAYFRLRGEVDVLGLVSAAIELYMALLYHFDSGKLIGEAKITVNVSAVGISKEVHIYAQRTFKGANGDPSFRDVMLEANGSSPAWTDYCQAFAEE